MNKDDDFTAGLENFSALLDDFEADESKVLDALEAGASALVEDVRKLPKPRSSVKKTGYTHVLDTVRHERKRKDVVVGWGRYYGLFLERGTRRMKAQPHLRPTWEANKEKYQKIILQKLWGGK